MARGYNFKYSIGIVLLSIIGCKSAYIRTDGMYVEAPVNKAKIALMHYRFYPDSTLVLHPILRLGELDEVDMIKTHFDKDPTNNKKGNVRDIVGQYRYDSKLKYLRTKHVDDNDTLRYTIGSVLDKNTIDMFLLDPRDNKTTIASFKVRFVYIKEWDTKHNKKGRD